MAHFYTPANESHPMKYFLLAMSIVIVFAFSHIDTHKKLDPVYSGSRAVTVNIDPPVQAVADPPLALAQAGFTPDQVNMMLAIGMAESHLRVDALGDQSLENDKWGPSVGAWQIRTLKNPVSNRCRDRQYLEGNLSHQAECAFEISGHGTNYRPWSVYLHGTYKQYMIE